MQRRRTNVPVSPVAKACHLTTCRLRAPTNPGKRAQTRHRDAPISVHCLVIDTLGCLSKSCRTNPAKDTLLHISLARQDAMSSCVVIFRYLESFTQKLFVACVTQRRRPNPVCLPVSQQAPGDSADVHFAALRSQ